MEISDHLINIATKDVAIDDIQESYTNQRKIERFVW